MPSPRTILLFLCVLACGGSDAPTSPYDTGNNPPPPDPSAVEIGVLDNYYSPDTRTVTSGATVKWVWDGGGYSDHTVTFEDGTGSGSMSSGSYSRVFNQPGTYTYHCAVHGAAVMSGTIVVGAAN